ncbi:MAG: FmdB family zinc ribbon protein [Planctomycetota bacterium]
MPTYEYVCDACGHRFERFQSITAPAARKCPECGKMKLRRLIGNGAGIIFRGSGFYQTDYRSSSYNKAASAETKPAASDQDNASTSSTPPSTGSEAAG